MVLAEPTMQTNTKAVPAKVSPIFVLAGMEWRGAPAVRLAELSRRACVGPTIVLLLPPTREHR
jgi:hypothetical protein